MCDLVDKLGTDSEQVLQTVHENVFSSAIAVLLRAADPANARSRGDAVGQRYSEQLLAILARPDKWPSELSGVRSLRPTPARLDRAFADPPRSLRAAVNVVLQLWAAPGGKPSTMDRLDDVRAAFLSLQAGLERSADPEEARFAVAAKLFFAMADYYTTAVYSLHRVAQHEKKPTAIEVARAELDVLMAAEGHTVAAAGEAVERMRLAQTRDGAYVRGCASIQRAVTNVQRISDTLAGTIPDV